MKNEEYILRDIQTALQGPSTETDVALRSLGVSRLAGGDINDTYTIERPMGRDVLQVIHPSFAPEHQLLSAYFHPNKGAKIAALQSLLARGDIPVPRVLGLGKGEPAPWIVTEFAQGKNLAEIYENLNQEERLKVVKNMGRLLGQIHTIPVTQELADIIYPREKPNLKNTIDRHSQRFETICRLLYERGAIDREMFFKAIGWHVQHQNDLPSISPVFVHRDFFQRNVFVDTETLDIKSVIDWGDTADIDDPVKDATLAAWWIADNFDTQENLDIFKAFLEAYNDLAPSPVDLDKAKSLLEIYNLQWYCELALYETYKGSRSELMGYLERVCRIINRHGGNVNA